MVFCNLRTPHVLSVELFLYGLLRGDGELEKRRIQDIRLGQRPRHGLGFRSINQRRIAPWLLRFSQSLPQLLHYWY